MKPIFLLGVGAQKAGTTWVYNYLNQLPEVDMGFKKEYHVWDASDILDCANFKVPLKDWCIDRSAFRLWRMQKSKREYFKYFERLVSRPGKTITGDITPSYAGLSTERLRSIRDSIVDCGMDCRVMFLMRDPLERCWSAARMYRRNLQRSGEILQESEELTLREQFQSNGMRFRTQYHKTIDRLEAVFDDNQLYYGIFETMMRESEVSRFAQFLGVEERFDLTSAKVNVSPKSSTIPDDLARAIVSEYREVYDFCGERFPITQEVWPGQKFLGE